MTSDLVLMRTSFPKLSVADKVLWKIDYETDLCARECSWDGPYSGVKEEEEESRKRKKLSCDADVTKVSANPVGGSGVGIILQSCCV